MLPEAKKIVEAFVNEKSFKFQLSIAAGTVGATMKDATNWRQRGQLPYPPQKVSGRYFVTSDGFVALGVMAELSWLMGPDIASRVAETVVEDLFLGTPFRFDIEEFAKMSFEFQKPRADDATAALDYPKMMEEDDLDPWANSGFRLSYSSPETRNISPQRATVVVPIGELVARWAVHYDWASK